MTDVELLRGRRLFLGIIDVNEIIQESKNQCGFGSVLVIPDGVYINNKFIRGVNNEMMKFIYNISRIPLGVGIFERSIRRDITATQILVAQSYGEVYLRLFNLLDKIVSPILGYTMINSKLSERIIDKIPKKNIIFNDKNNQLIKKLTLKIVNKKIISNDIILKHLVYIFNV